MLCCVWLNALCIKLNKYLTKIDNEINLIQTKLKNKSKDINTIEKIYNVKLSSLRSELFVLEKALVEINKNYEMTALIGELKFEGPLIEPKKILITVGFLLGLFLSIILAVIRNSLRKKEE